MAHLCVPQNQALGVCRGFVPDIQVCGTHGREDLVNATIASNAKEAEEKLIAQTWKQNDHRIMRTSQECLSVGRQLLYLASSKRPTVPTFIRLLIINAYPFINVYPFIMINLVDLQIRL